MLFVKTSEPIEPVSFCTALCTGLKKSFEEAQSCWRPRYINRLTPVTDVAKATEDGVNEVGRKVLPRWFTINSDLDNKTDVQAKKHEPGLSVRAPIAI